MKIVRKISWNAEMAYKEMMKIDKKQIIQRVEINKFLLTNQKNLLENINKSNQYDKQDNLQTYESSDGLSIAFSEPEGDYLCLPFILNSSDYRTYLSQLNKCSCVNVKGIAFHKGNRPYVSNGFKPSKKGYYRGKAIAVRYDGIEIEYELDTKYSSMFDQIALNAGVIALKSRFTFLKNQSLRFDREILNRKDFYIDQYGVIVV